MSGPKKILIALEYNYREMIDGILKFAMEKEWFVDCNLVFSDFHSDYPNSCDGIIASCYTQKSAPLRKFVQKQNVPVVYIDSVVSGSFSILRDYYKVPGLIYNYLHRLGLNKYYTFGSQQNYYFKLLADYLKDHKQSYEHIEESLSCWNERHDEICSKLQSLEFPCAVICAHDASANRLLQCCKELGIRVPEQISIIGCCNEAVRCEYTEPSLTSVDMNHFKVGYLAGKYLEKAFNGEVPSNNQPIWIKPGGIVSRGSTDLLATANIQLKSLIKYIEENFAKGIGVADVVKYSGLSKSSVDRLFKSHFDRGPGDILHEFRMNEAVRLLVSTTDKVEYIARKTGYSSQPCFTKAFKKVFELSPTEYRKINMKERQNFKCEFSKK